MNLEKIEKLVYELLIALGENPKRSGLLETPKRVANMLKEVFAGIAYSNDQIAEMFDKCFESDSTSMVVLKQIPCFSYCEHHLALIYDMKISIGYIPNGKVLGLSKIARIADMVCKRLQIQEKISKDISYIIKKIINNDDVAVYIEAVHSCLSARGIKKESATTITFETSGRFNLPAFKNDFLQSIQK